MSDQKDPADRPATFGEVFASRQFRAIYAAVTTSYFGDMVARAAVTALVYEKTHSVGLSALAFAISYLPWVLGGPILAALADRHPYRTTMIISDVCRAVTIGLVALPGMPISLVILLLFLTALGNPPFDASRSALLPRVFTDNRLYVAGLSISVSTRQGMIFIGYVTGASLGSLHPTAALLIDSATFLVSAAILAFGVHSYAAEPVPQERRNLLRETGDGFRIVFGTPVLRSIAIVVFTVSIFSIAPEGLGAAWAGEVTSNPSHRAIDQAIIMSGPAFGLFLGGLVFTRFFAAGTRQRMIRPLSILVPLSITPAVLHPPVYVVGILGTICGACLAGQTPPANGLFVQALPQAYRARAFGVMQGGLQVLQGMSVFVVGALAEHGSVPTVVGVWCLAGVLVTGVAIARWPSDAAFTDAIDRATAANAAVARTPTSSGGSGGLAPQHAPSPATTL